MGTCHTTKTRSIYIIEEKKLLAYRPPTGNFALQVFVKVSGCRVTCMPDNMTTLYGISKMSGVYNEFIPDRWDRAESLNVLGNNTLKLRQGKK